MRTRRGARFAADAAMRRYERARVARRDTPNAATVAEYDSAKAAWLEAERRLYLLTHGVTP